MKIKRNKTLAKLHPCDRAARWVGTKTFHQAWKTCKIGAWMAWLGDELYRQGHISDTTRMDIYLASCARPQDDGLTTGDRVRALGPKVTQEIAKGFKADAKSLEQ